jgi:hypothetical protein
MLIAVIIGATLIAAYIVYLILKATASQTAVDSDSQQSDNTMSTGTKMVQLQGQQVTGAEAAFNLL